MRNVGFFNLSSCQQDIHAWVLYKDKDLSREQAKRLFALCWCHRIRLNLPPCHVMNTLLIFIPFKTAGEKPHVPCDCGSIRAARFLDITELRYGVTSIVHTCGLVWYCSYVMAVLLRLNHPLTDCYVSQRYEVNSLISDKTDWVIFISKMSPKRPTFVQ